VKPIKMLGLAALAALAAMALVGVSSAMAESTALCKAEESTCSGANTITHVHESQVGKAKLLSEPTVECKVVLFLGDTKNAAKETKGLANPLRIEGAFTYKECNNSCTVKEEEGPAVILVLKEGSELATVTGEGLVHLTCFFGFINCKYNGEGLIGHGLGPLTSAQENGSVDIEEQETHREAGGCPETAFLDLTTTPLEKTYISS
jgi:hypothetical protein